MKNLKLNSFILITMFLISKMSFAQLTFEWAKSYSDPGARSQSAYDAVTDTLGNIYVTGMVSNGYCVNDMLTVKYNSSGQFQWGRTFNTSSEYTGEIGKSIAIYRNGAKTYIYAAGEVGYSGMTQFIKIIKYDENGNTKWQREYDPGVPEPDQLTKVLTDASGSCYVAGSTQSKTYVAKYDSSGNLVYNLVRNAPAGYVYTIVTDAVIDASKNIYLTGSIDTSGTKHILNLKIDSAGIFKWQKLFRMNTAGYQSTGAGIKVGKSGSIYLTGDYYNAATHFDYIIIKLNQTTGDTIWTRKYNALNTADLGKKIALDANDNVYVSGTSYIGSYENIHTLKYDSNGVQKWVKIYNGPGGYSDVVNDIGCDNSGNVYLTGASDNSYFGSYLTMKYNPNGDVLWTKVIDVEAGAFEAATAMAFDKNGNTIVTGIAGNSGTDIATIKYSSSGVQQWSKKFYGAEITEDVSNHVVTDKKGYIYQIGKARTTQYGDNIQIIKYNSDGVRKWVYNRGGTFAGYNAYDEGNSIAVDTLGNVYFTGTVFSVPGNKQDIVTGKLDSNGTEQWYTVRVGLDGNDAGNDIALDSARNVYVSGESRSISGDANFILIKYNNSGVEQWVRAYAGAAGRNDVPNAMTIDRFGNIFVTGTSANNSGESEIVTIKYSNIGVQQWIKIYNGTAPGADNGNCIVNDIFGHVYVGGSANNTTTGSDFLMLKYKNDAGGTLEFVRTASNKDDDCKEEITAMLVDTSHFANPDSTEFYVHFAGNTCKWNSDKITAVKGVYLPGISYLTGATDDYAIPGSIESKTYGLAINNRDFFDWKAIYMTGTTTDNSNNTNIFVKKYYSNSPHIFNTNLYDGGIYEYDGQYGSKNNQAAVDINNKAYIGGASYDTVQGSEMTLLKVYEEDYEFEIEMFIQGLFVLDQYNQPALKPDTITVYMRNSTAPYSIVDSARGLINANAYGTFFFSNVVNGVDYYIAIKHRNSLETWTYTTRSFNNNYTYFYFSGPHASYGSNQIMLGEPDDNLYGNFSGDVNQDGTIDATDLALIDNDAYNFNSGYIRTDLNYDEFTDATDLAMADNNAANFVSVARP